MVVAKGRLPDFLVIGAMKAGTTSLHSYLDQHPEVAVSREKELQFFVGRNFEQRGLDWYRGQLASDARVVGEASPQYTQVHRFPEVPRNIAATVPSAKLIYIVRNPYRRLISNYLQNLASDQLHLSFSEKMSQLDLAQHSYVQTSMYGFQLAAYLEHFERSQVHVLSLERLQRHRLMELNAIYAFLGLEPMPDERCFGYVANRSSSKRAEGRFVEHLRRHPIGRALRGWLPSSVRSAIRESRAFQLATTRKLPEVRMTATLRDQLREIFEPDLQRFQEVTGEEFPELFLLPEVSS